MKGANSWRHATYRKCYRCGEDFGRNHLIKSCKAIHKYCRYCGGIGHLPQLCFSRSMCLPAHRTSVRSSRHSTDPPSVQVEVATTAPDGKTKKPKSKSKSPAQKRRDVARSKDFKQQRNTMAIFPSSCLDNEGIKNIGTNHALFEAIQNAKILSKEASQYKVVCDVLKDDAKALHIILQIKDRQLRDLGSKLNGVNETEAHKNIIILELKDKLEESALELQRVEEDLSILARGDHAQSFRTENVKLKQRLQEVTNLTQRRQKCPPAYNKRKQHDVNKDSEQYPRTMEESSNNSTDLFDAEIERLNKLWKSKPTRPPRR